MAIFRKKILVQGVVQGVGFRPFVYRLAAAENLKGFVLNSPQGVEIEVEGQAGSLDRFLQALKTQAPVLAKIRSMKATDIPVRNDSEFIIRESREGEDPTALISPDVSVCEDCLVELFDPKDRRYRYPFINCTNCGPRYTIIRDIPYDRKHTTMSGFKMCPDCQAEYDDPKSRRFHAQPNACPVCGPRIELTYTSGRSVQCDDPIREAAALLKQGKILAIKGIGGFHLACDATNGEAVQTLRKRKEREEKPLAVMALDVGTARLFVDLSDSEKELLVSWHRPIVLLAKKNPNPIAESVSPRNGYFGVQLPYTPLHHLILSEGFTALVMTSGNSSEEPIAFENGEAFRRLGSIADFFLVHDRDIFIRNDDAVMRFAAGLPSMIRRSRGFVPHPIFLKKKMPSVLAVGGEMKNTVCLISGDRAFLSQHIGDLENVETLASFELSTKHLSRILQIHPETVAHDLHPDYLSTQWALGRKGIRTIGVQHHHAHIVSCLAENGRDDRVIGIALDGTGYGTDGKIWGGEILIADPKDFRRAGHFAYRPMPGGSAAIREPWRMAVSYLDSAFGREFGPADSESVFLDRVSRLPLALDAGIEKVRSVFRLLHSGIPKTETSSLGRLFDGIAALAGIRFISAYEGQAAMELEMAMDEEGQGLCREDGYTFEILDSDQALLINPDPVIMNVYQDVISGVAVDRISLKFHLGLVRTLADICRRVRAKTGLGITALSGGCFQNRFLLENLKSELHKSGFEVVQHSQIPANDGGLALGQAMVAAASMSTRK